MGARSTALLVGAVALLAGACCCQPPLQQKVANLEAENTQLRFQLDATKKANEASRDYAAELASGHPKEPLFSMYYTPLDLNTMAANAVPYRIDAREFNNQLSGTVVIDHVTNFALQPGNRLTCKLHLHGERIEYHGNVPGAYQKMVEDFKAGIAAGVIADMDVSLTNNGNMVQAMPHVVQTRMLRNSTPTFESNLRDQMNQQAFRSPISFNVTVAGKSVLVKRLLVTGNHVIVGYAAH